MILNSQRFEEQERSGEYLYRRSRRRRWLYLMPVIFVTYSLAYLDRANFGFGAAAGLAATLQITGARTALLSAVFFLGYFLFQLPAAAYARRRSASRIVFAALIAWGTLAALTGIVRQFWLLLVDRFLLGAAESVIFPAMLMLLTRWFTKTERSRANTFLILGNPVTVLWMSVITGYLIQRIGWQLTFVVEGLPSLVWAFLWIGIVSDRPVDARWMDASSAAQLQGELEIEQKRIARVGGVLEALLRVDVLMLAAMYFGWSLGVYGFVLWLPTIIRQGTDLGMGTTGLLTAFPYVLAVVLMLVVSFMSDRRQVRSSIVWPFLILSGCALMVSFMTANRSFWWAYVALVCAGGCMYAPYGPFFAIIPEVIPENVCAEVMAVVNGSGALGGFAGAWMVGLLQARTGDSRAGYLLMSLSLILSGLTMAALGLQQSRQRCMEADGVST